MKAMIRELTISSFYRSILVYEGFEQLFYLTMIVVTISRMQARIKITTIENR